MASDRGAKLFLLVLLLLALIINLAASYALTKMGRSNEIATFSAGEALGILTVFIAGAIAMKMEEEDD